MQNVFSQFLLHLYVSCLTFLFACISGYGMWGGWGGGGCLLGFPTIYISLRRIYCGFQAGQRHPRIDARRPFIYFCTSKNFSRVFPKALMFRRTFLRISRKVKTKHKSIFTTHFRESCFFFSGGGGDFLPVKT